MIYLASPYSHPDPAVRRWRYDKVCALTADLLQAGRHVFSPIVYSHSLAERFSLPGSWDFWQRVDLEFIDRCDEVLVYQLPGWEESVGVQAEIAYAKEQGKPVCFLPDDGQQAMTRRLPKIAICGHGQAGKDTAARILTLLTPLRLGRTTSEVIAPHRAAELGISVDEAFAQRHTERDIWYELGNRLRAHDAAYLVRETLRDGEICVGIRDPEELLAARREGLIDITLWIDRDVAPDPTMKFGPENCEVVIPNRQGLFELERRLEAVARFAGLLKEDRG